MSNIQPHGEDLRKAVKWISEQRQCNSGRAINALVQDACAIFDLSPKDSDFLSRFALEECKKLKD